MMLGHACELLSLYNWDKKKKLVEFPATSLFDVATDFIIIYKCYILLFLEQQQQQKNHQHIAYEKLKFAV